MTDTNDRVRQSLLSLLLDPRCLTVGLACGIVGYLIGRIAG